MTHPWNIAEPPWKLKQEPSNRSHCQGESSYNYDSPTGQWTRPMRLWRQPRPGSRVVSHDFHMGGQWPSEQIVRIRDMRVGDVRVGDMRVADKTLYAWTITPDLRAYATGQA